VSDAAPVYRAPMRARGHDDVERGAGAEHGLRLGVVAIGDRDARRIERLAGLPDGAFVWTRDRDGRYWLGRVEAGAVRRAPDDAAGLTHVRPARWRDRPFGDDEVPAAVAASFARGGRNLQRIRDPSAGAATAACWRARR
jgi:hypothetical protein